MAYRRGQEVFRDPKPFVYYVQPEYHKVVCDWCLKMCKNEGILKKCTRCQWVYYCDQNCQKEAWDSHHKLECKYLQKQNMPLLVKEHFDGNFQVIQEVYLKLLKTILKLKNSGRKEFFQLPNGKKRYFADLVSNADELRIQNEPNESMQYEVYKTWLGDAMPSFTEYFEIIGKWHTNSSSMFAMDFRNPIVVASGLYLGYSSLDHSCVPNVIRFNVGKEMVVRTIEDVENLSEIRISYINEIEKTHERQKILKENYFFDCKCLRCEDPNSDAKFSSLKCKSCPGWVNENTKICSGCHQKLRLSEEELTIVEKYKNGTLPKFTPTMKAREIRSTLERYVKIFHGSHEIFKQCVDVVLNSPTSVSQNLKGDHDTLLILLQLQLNFSSEHLPQYHEVFMCHHDDILYACITLRLFDEAELHLKKAEDICKVVYGEDHPYLQECQKLKMLLQVARVQLK